MVSTRGLTVYTGAIKTVGIPRWECRWRLQDLVTKSRQSNTWGLDIPQSRFKIPGNSGENVYPTRVPRIQVLRYDSPVARPSAEREYEAALQTSARTNCEPRRRR